MTQQGNKNRDLDFLNNNIGLVQGDIEEWVQQNPDNEKALLESKSVNKETYDEVNLEDQIKRQNLDHENQNQDIRKKHLNYLFTLTIIWISFIWVVLILQGFGGYPFQQTSKVYDFLKFNLSDAVLIAFMTTTTATVLGLYGIGAYWLFKSKLPEKPKSEDSKQEE